MKSALIGISLLLCVTAGARADQVAAASKSLDGAALSQQREAHKADIAYWSTRYDGADLKAGQFDCARPAIPALSKTSEDIKAVDAAMATWRACYDGFVKNLVGGLPPGKRLPADIDALMTDQEYGQAIRHIDAVYTKVGSEELAGAKAIMAAHAAWMEATVHYVAQTNAANKARATAQAKTQEEYARGTHRNEFYTGFFLMPHSSLHN